MRCSSLGCRGPACRFPLNFDGTPMPAMCCDHMDMFMARLGQQVPADEGTAGLAKFRADHELFHVAEAVSR